MLDLETQRQVSEAAEADAPIALRHATRFYPGESGQKAAEGDAPLHARHVHADTDVVAVAERDVAVGLAPDVEPVRIGKLRRIAVRRADADRDQGAFRERAAADPHRRD